MIKPNKIIISRVTNDSFAWKNDYNVPRLADMVPLFIFNIKNNDIIDDKYVIQRTIDGTTCRDSFVMSSLCCSNTIGWIYNNHVYIDHRLVLNNRIQHEVLTKNYLNCVQYEFIIDENKIKGVEKLQNNKYNIKLKGEFLRSCLEELHILPNEFIDHILYFDIEYDSVVLKSKMILTIVNSDMNKSFIEKNHPEVNY